MSAHGLKITNFHYTNTVLQTFPATDYPKWVYPGPMSKTGQLVNSAEEEAAYYAALENKEELPKPKELPPLATDDSKPTIILTGGQDEREILLQVAKEKNIKIDARWSNSRIQATLERETKDQ